MKKLCIYHANCADGFTSAWVVRKKFSEEQVDFYPGTYGFEPPSCTGREIIMVDFTYKREMIIKLAAQAKSVLILDHHKSAQKDLVDLPDNVTAIFDMERSGARITWDHYFPAAQPGSLIKHVEDRDLWRFAMTQTRAFQANLFSYEYTFANWDMIAALCADDYKYWSFIAEGEAIERKHFKDVNELIKSASFRSHILGHNVPTLNAPYFFSSDAGHIMGAGEPFAACYWDTSTARIYSLRSDELGQDVSEIAAQFGGGGHAHAAGFQIPNGDFSDDRINRTDSE